MLCSFEGPRGRGLEQFPVALAWGKHLFPFRTEQLSPTAPMVLGLHGPGRVGRRRFFLTRAAHRAARLRSDPLAGGPPPAPRVSARWSIAPSRRQSAGLPRPRAFARRAPTARGPPGGRPAGVEL